MNSIVALSVLGILTLISGVFKAHAATMRFVVMAGLLVVLGINFYDLNGVWDEAYVMGMVNFDAYAVQYTVLFSVAILLLFATSDFYVSDLGSFGTERITLFVFTLVGMVVMVSFGNLTMLFLGLEIMSVSLYILAGSSKKSTASNEAAMKYFLMGAFATGILLMGITLVYGETGAFDINQITYWVNNNTPGPIFMVGMFLMLIGLAFKVSAVPFHFWAPDVYEGSPTFVTAFMSSVVKVAGFAAFFRLFSTIFAPVVATWTDTLWVICLITITVGGVTALVQTDAKRLLAYSGISHAGYMLMSVLVLFGSASSYLYFYSIAYIFAGISGFAVLSAVEKATGTTSLTALSGLVKNQPLLAITLATSLASMAGLPITSGFFGKFYVLQAAMDAGFTTLVVLALVNAGIGVYYYFKLLNPAFFGEATPSHTTIKLSPLFTAALVVLIFCNLALGLFSGMFI